MLAVFFCPNRLVPLNNSSMQIIISNPVVVNQFRPDPVNFEIFHSTCCVDGVAHTFSRSVDRMSWPNTQIKINNQIIGIGEDPRAFDLLGMPACYSVHYNDYESFVPQLYVKTDDEWIRMRLQMAEAIKPGKNWAPFVYRDEVYFVHEISPFRLLKLEGDTVTTVFTQELAAESMPIDGYPVLRGGCNGFEIAPGKILGFGHDNRASNPRDINTIRHRPFAWLIDMASLSVELIPVDFDWGTQYNLMDPTALYQQDGQLYLMTFEAELVMHNINQNLRTCLYPINITL